VFPAIDAGSKGPHGAATARTIGRTAVNPPSTDNTCPVTQLVSSESSQTIAPADDRTARSTR
jgi:hypothetical protein